MVGDGRQPLVMGVSDDASCDWQFMAMRVEGRWRWCRAMIVGGRQLPVVETLGASRPAIGDCSGPRLKRSVVVGGDVAGGWGNDDQLWR